MKEYNVTSLISDYQIVKISDGDGNSVKELKFKKLSARRTFEISERFIGIQKDKPENKDGIVTFEDIKKNEKIFDQLLNLCFDSVRPTKIIDCIKSRLSKNYISKKWLMENMDFDNLNIFINSILAPIRGEKKTVGGS